MQLKKHLVTASYVDSSLSMLDDKAKEAGITILGEMGLDPGIGKTYSDNYWLFLGLLQHNIVHCNSASGFRTWYKISFWVIGLTSQIFSWNLCSRLFTILRIAYGYFQNGWMTGISLRLIDIHYKCKSIYIVD